MYSQLDTGEPKLHHLEINRIWPAAEGRVIEKHGTDLL